MNDVPLWKVVRDWFGRLVMRRPDRMATHDWFEELWNVAEMEDEVPASGGPALTPAAVKSLERQVNAITPWNVRVDVESRPQGTAVRCSKQIGAGRSAQGHSAGADDGPPLSHLLNVLGAVQMFMVQGTDRAWPKRDRLTREERMGDLEPWVRRLPLPDGVVENGEARLWYGDRDRPVLELDPIPVS
jgi:hypothetical protein